MSIENAEEIIMEAIAGLVLIIGFVMFIVMYIGLFLSFSFVRYVSLLGLVGYLLIKFCGIGV